MVFVYFFEKPSMDFFQFHPLKELLMLQWEHRYSLNGVFWTLGVECQFYLIAPLFILLFRQDQLAKVCIRIALVIVVLLVVKNLWDYQDLRRIDARNLFGNLVHFLVGILVAFLYPLISSKSKSFKLNDVLLICCTACLLLLLTNYFYFYHRLVFWTGGILLVDFFTILILIIHIMFETKKTMAPKCLTPLLGLGTLSYGIYAWHGAVSRLSVLCKESFTANVLISIVLAYLTYVFIEKPLRKYRTGNAQSHISLDRGVSIMNINGGF